VKTSIRINTVLILSTIVFPMILFTYFLLITSDIPVNISKVEYLIALAGVLLYCYIGIIVVWKNGKILYSLVLLFPVLFFINSFISDVIKSDFGLWHDNIQTMLTASSFLILMVNSISGIIKSIK